MATDKNIPVYDVEELVDLRAVWVGLRRRADLFAAVSVTTLLAVVAFTFLSTELYTAETSLMIEPKTELFAYGKDMFPQTAVDPQLVDTQVELLRSRAMSIRVVDRQRDAEKRKSALASDEADDENPTSDFFAEGLADAAVNLSTVQNTGVEEPASEDDIPDVDEMLEGAPLESELAAVDEDAQLSSGADTSEAALGEAIARTDNEKIRRMLSHLEIERVGATFLIKIRYSSPSPQEAAEIANAYAEEFILEQLEAQFAALRQANQWLDARLSVLRKELRLAEEASAQFRAEHGLVEATGSSFTELALTGIATDLAAARSNLATLRARYSTVRGIVAAGAPVESISEVMSSSVIADLRRQQTEVTRRRAELTVRYGDRHPELKKVKEEAVELQAQLDREVKRIVGSLRAEVGFAAAQVRSLERSRADAQGDLATNNASLVALLDLERNSEATRGVYEALLNRQKELNERDRLADANARIIARAEPPDSPSKPRKKLLLAGGLMLALLMGGATSFTAEALDTRIKNTHDIRREFGAAAPVVLIPRIQSRLLFRQRQSDDVVRKYIYDEPDSTFAESLRDLRMHLKTAEGGAKSSVSIAFTSIFKGEGKTTTSFSFASLLAKSGKRVAFIDCATEAHRFSKAMRSIGRSYDGDSEPEYLEVQAGPAEKNMLPGKDEKPGAPAELEEGNSNTLDKITEIRSQQLTTRSTPLEQYPITTGETKCGVVMIEFEDGVSPHDDFHVNAFTRTLDQIRDDYDYIVIDAPAVLSKPEASVIAAAADFTVVITEWCVTTRGAARAGVQRLMDARAQILSFVIAKVDEKQRYYFRPEDGQFYFKKPS